MNQSIQRRVFLVGCPRSGTTLLQCFLGAHSAIATYPESHYYLWLFAGRAWRKHLGIAGRRARFRWNKYLEDIGRPEMQKILPWYATSVRQYSDAFVSVFDDITLGQGKSIWLEKTPLHLRCVDQLQRLVNKARFIHIIRNGKDVVASLYDIGTRYASEWGNVVGYGNDHRSQPYRDIDECIHQWVTLTRLSLKYQSCEDHILVRYERLTRDPQSELMRLCAFLGISFEEQMLIEYPKIASEVVLENELWKKNAGGPVYTPRSKFDVCLNEEQRMHVLRSLPQDLMEFVSD